MTVWIGTSGWQYRDWRAWSADEDCFTYFNNDPRGCAPRDAARFATQVERAGLRPSRTPPVRSVRVG